MADKTGSLILNIFNQIKMLLLFSLLVVFSTVSTAETGLYKPSDPMVQFTNDTIKGHLVGSNKVWIVEFYSSWCGHCQAFAPTWIRLATQLKNWNTYVSVGVLDCASEQNYDTCKAFGIESYPTIKFFNINWYNNTKEDESPGTTYQGVKDIKHMRERLIEHMEKQVGGVFQKSEIPFSFFTKADVDNYISKKDFVVYNQLALLFENPISSLGKSLVLDTIKCKKLVVRRVSSENNELSTKYDVATYPSLVLITLATEEYRHLSPSNRSHVAFVSVLNEVTGGDILSKNTDVKTTPQIIDEDQLAMAANISSEVYMQDLASAVAFSLRREVPKKKNIAGPAMLALKDWVNLLVKCLPAEKSLANFLEKMDKWLRSPAIGTEMKSEKFLNYIENNQGWDSLLPMEIKWRGCEGSASKYRGFPCGLWTLFHTLTVRCGTAKTETDLAGVEILRRVRNFIDYFFGCSYCRKHFLKMAENVVSEVTNHEEAILWLWSRHNRANARLHDDISSDPLHPKVQFPPERMCAECRNPTDVANTIVTSPGYGNGELRWNRRVVLEFLREHYSPDNIRIRDHIHTQDIESANADTVRNRITYKFFSRTASPPITILGMSRIDMSICVLLYGAIIASVFALYTYFIRRRKVKTYKSLV